MKCENVKSAIYKSGLNVTKVSKLIGQSVANLNTKIKRETLTDKEMDEISSVLNCKYKCYFEFKDGTKIGKF